MNLEKFYQSITDYLRQAGIVGPSSVDWSIDPEAVIQWPSRPTPFLLVVPLRARNYGDDEGGGRWAKDIIQEVDVHVVVGNVLDPSYADTGLMTSASSDLGPMSLVGSVIDKFEQCYLTNAGDLTTIEFPRMTSIGSIHRFKGTSEYVSIPVSFTMSMAPSMPSTVVSSMTPN